ncbi:TetR/AcrR family transcriptional regulator [Daejeonella lutea]|uniref:Transcriptional regulator, TetR family n=1 Tax=Daejeonella lutea TaxID=572036 RepID=A0A1T5EBN0_9SPHI|nr:TetR/AcrR family transcriptional regulator [Daejeonella lutea]SKB81402.1 transcriptional regulator, TetR family [Daejeonella lutea]
MSKSTNTRATILQKAFDLIYIRGYQATSIDDIIATTQVTKGAFYYHFANKDQMGLAVINEIILPEMYQGFIQPLKGSEKPAKDIYRMIRHILFDIPFFKVEYGCPLANLISEMAPLNQDFKLALNKISDKCIDALKDSFKHGRKAGKIRSGINEEETAYFILSGYWGIRNIGKTQNTAACYEAYLGELKRYLKGL